MLKSLGRLIWKQSREMNVLNYAHHQVYEVYTNRGFQYILLDKNSDSVSMLRKNDMDRLTKNIGRIDENLQNLWGDKGRQGIL